MHERLPWRKEALRGAAAAAFIFICAIPGAPPSPAQETGSLPSGTPATAWDQFREGERRYRQGDLKGSLEIFSQARKSLAAGRPLDRSLVDALALDLYNLAAALTTAGDAESSLACFGEIFGLRETAGSLRDAAFEKALLAGSEQVADYAVSAGKARLAIPIYRARLKTDPSAEAPRLRLAAALLSIGAFEDLRTEVEAIRKLNPRSAETWALTGRAGLAEATKLTSGGSQHEARIRSEWGTADLRQASELDPLNQARWSEHALAAAGLAVLLDEEGDYTAADAARESAVASLLEARKLAPGAGGIALDLARVHRSSGRLREAIPEYALATKSLEKEGSPAALREARAERSACLVTLAGDAVNEGRFAEARDLLTEARPLDPNRVSAIEALGALLEERRSEFERIEKDDLAALKANPDAADPATSLSDLYASYARYDEAWRYLEIAASAAEGRPSDAVLRDRAYRIRSGSPEPARKSEVTIDGLDLTFQYAREEGLTEIRKALPAAWRQSAAVLGPPPGDPPVIEFFANQRALRESGVPRIGATVVAAYHRGVLAFYVDPHRDVSAWTAAIAGGIGMWEADRLSRGRAPEWLVRGISRRVAGGGEGIDRAALSRAASDGRWIAIGDLDEALSRAWNDPSRLPLLEAESLALVKSLERARGPSSLRALLSALAEGSGTGIEHALGRIAAMSTAALDASARASLTSPVAPVTR